MTDREKKQREILRNLANCLDQLSRQKHTKKDEDCYINGALSELSKLDAMPTPHGLPLSLSQDLATSIRQSFGQEKGGE